MEVGRAENAHLAGLHQLGERFERCLLRRVIVVLMREIEIDTIGAEPRERRIARCRDARRVQLLPAFARQHADLSGD